MAPDIDGRAAEITQRLLQKDAAERFPDARTLIQEFDGILENISTVVPNEPPPPREPDPIFSMPTRPAPTPPSGPSSSGAPSASGEPPPPPPPPPARPSGPYTAQSQATRRVKQRMRIFVFWMLVLAGWGLCLTTGILAAPERGEGFWAGLLRSVSVNEESSVLRLCLAGVAVTLFGAGFIANRRAVAAASRPVVGFCLLIASAILLYAGGVHAPLGSGIGELSERLAEGLVEARAHPMHLGLLALWGLVSGLLLVVNGEEGNFARGVGCIVALLALALFLVVSSWGYWGVLPSFVLKDLGGALTFGSAAIVSFFGLFLGFKRKRHWALKGLGVLLVVLGAWGIHHFGRGAAEFGAAVAWSKANESDVSFVELLVHQGGLVTLGLLLATWTVWFLRIRIGRRQEHYPF